MLEYNRTLGCSDTSRNKFRARITVNGVGIHLGVFTSEAAAQAAYTEAKQTYHY